VDERVFVFLGRLQTPLLFFPSGFLTRTTGHPTARSQGEQGIADDPLEGG